MTTEHTQNPSDDLTWAPVEILPQTPNTAATNLHHSHRGFACTACEIIALREERDGLIGVLRGLARHTSKTGYSDGERSPCWCPYYTRTDGNHTEQCVAATAVLAKIDGVRATGIETTVDLDEYRTPGVRVFAGRDRGTAVRKAAQLDQLDTEPFTVVVKVPEDVFSVNDSFLTGMFAPSIQQLGAEDFRSKYVFEGKDLGRTIDRLIQTVVKFS